MTKVWKKFRLVCVLTTCATIVLPTPSLVANEIGASTLRAEVPDTTEQPIDAETIANRVADRLVQLKTNFPHLARFSVERHLQKNVKHAGFPPGSPNNPELFSIAYSHGATPRKADNRPAANGGAKRSAVYDFDPKMGIQLFVHVFAGNTRGNDMRPSIKVGRWSVHAYVQGPVAKPIRTEIVAVLKTLQKKQANARTSQATTDDDVLAVYLNGKNADDVALATVEELVRDAQLITLRYERDTPTTDYERESAFARSLKASHVQPLTIHKGVVPFAPGQRPQPRPAKPDKVYPGIEAVYSRLFGEFKDAPPSDWIVEMQRPVSAGYELKYVRVVKTPPRARIRQVFEKSQVVMKDVTGQLAKMKGDFPQLATFSVDNMNSGTWSDGWPRFSGVSYTHDVGKQTKGGRERLSKNWCECYVSIGPLTGSPRQLLRPTKQYPQHGIEVEWWIDSDNEVLNKRFSLLVQGAISSLDELK